MVFTGSCPLQCFRAACKEIFPEDSRTGGPQRQFLIDKAVHGNHRDLPEGVFFPVPFGNTVGYLRESASRVTLS